MLPAKTPSISYNSLMLTRHVVVAAPRSLPRLKANTLHPLARRLQFSLTSSIIAWAVTNSATPATLNGMTRKLPQETSCNGPRATRWRTRGGFSSEIETCASGPRAFSRLEGARGAASHLRLKPQELDWLESFIHRRTRGGFSSEIETRDLRGFQLHLLRRTRGGFSSEIETIA